MPALGNLPPQRFPERPLSFGQQQQPSGGAAVELLMLAQFGGPLSCPQQQGGGVPDLAKCTKAIYPRYFLDQNRCGAGVCALRRAWPALRQLRMSQAGHEAELIRNRNTTSYGYVSVEGKHAGFRSMGYMQHSIPTLGI
eukprot:6188268-Pleurochrysis_carterae.AAC.1